MELESEWSHLEVVPADIYKHEVSTSHAFAASQPVENLLAGKRGSYCLGLWDLGRHIYLLKDEVV